jgi:hypothetical protein
VTDIPIHLRVPAEQKARWVRESRAAGMRLTDWIVQRVEMQALVYDVTLYWHDGGSLFLGTVAAMTAAAAEEKALKHYTAQGKQIEEGGGFQVSSELLLPDDAAKWRARELAK